MICEVSVIITLFVCSNPKDVRVTTQTYEDSQFIEEYLKDFPSQNLVKMFKEEGFCIKKVEIKRDSDTIKECKNDNE